MMKMIMLELKKSKNKHVTLKFFYYLIRSICYCTKKYLNNLLFNLV